MAYLAKISQTSNDEKEKESVMFIEQLLKGYHVHTDIKQGEKGANTDGCVELLDENNRINGKITVQVKTVNKRDEGKFKFPCPTSLFAYADCNAETVVLLAVDHQKRIVLWKHISIQLLDDNRNKENQETITLSFSEEEQMSENNVEDTIQKWRNLAGSNVKIFKSSYANQKENEELRKALINSPSSKLDLSKEDVVKTQLFLDTYNYLFDNELFYFKKIFYTNCWKNGVAIYKYENQELVYSLFPILYGENSLLIKQFPYSMLSDCKDPFVSMNSESNEIKEHPRLCAINLVERKIMKFVKEVHVLPSYDALLLEYVRDICSQYPSRIKTEHLEDLNGLIAFFEKKYSGLKERSIYTTYYSGNINIGDIYDVLKLLRSRGYSRIPIIYPERGQYGNTGWIWDSFSKVTAFEKLNIVVKLAYSTYFSFFDNEMPIVPVVLRHFDGANLIIYSLDYNTGNSPLLNAYYLETVNPSDSFNVECYLSEVFPLKKENDIKSEYELYNGILYHKGVEYKLKKRVGCDIKEYLFSRFNVQNVFNTLLKNQLSSFFELMKKTV